MYLEANLSEAIEVIAYISNLCFLTIPIENRFH